MTTLLIALGNRWRRDDGAGPRVLELLEPLTGIRKISQIQATPELAEQVANAKRVVWIDAACDCDEVRLERLREGTPGVLSHAAGPEEVTVLARRLFGFTGEALQCRIPGNDFSEGEGLSEATDMACRAAAILLRELLNVPRAAPPV